MPTTDRMASTDYEVLIRNIHDALIRADGYQTIAVQHDVRVPGRSGQAHQIDVFWRFDVAGVEHRTAIECKRYMRPVSIDVVRSFSAVIEDIGNTCGVIVTTVGFQSGAQKFAASKGIRLLTLRSPRDDDLAGLILSIVLNIRAANRTTEGFDVGVSPEWVKDHQDIIGQITTISIGGMNNALYIFNPDGTPVRSFWELENECPTFSDEGEPLPDNKILTHTIDISGKCIDVPGFGLIPLGHLRIHYRVRYIECQSVVRPQRNVAYVMREPASGKRTLVLEANDGSLTPKPVNKG